MRLALAIAFPAFIVMACGGQVEGGFTGDGGTTSGPRPPSPSSTGPTTASGTLAELSTKAGRAYCESFAKCCAGLGQPPIDAARCESVIAAALIRDVGQDARRGSSVAIDACAAAVAVRAARCPKEDAPWPRFGGSSPALLLPTSVYPACAALIGGSAASAAPACNGTSAGCPAGTTCAVDTCLDVAQPGTACDGLCIDSQVCAPSLTCEPPQRGANGQACARDGCQPGLVCVGGKCAPARENTATKYQDRDSPYSVRPEACRRFDFL